jgi:iron complex outermembrane receptor protein
MLSISTGSVRINVCAAGAEKIMKYKTPTFAFAIFLVGMAGAAHAVDIGDINITSSRAHSAAASSSNTVTVIDRKSIERAHVENVVDLLEGQPGIVVSDTSGVGAKSRVDLGGYGETAAANSLVLIDGRRVNSPDLSGTDWTQIPVDQIERIEIVHGGGSALYGDGAVGGVINIITRIPEAGGHVAVSGGSFGSYAGAASIGVDLESSRAEANLSTTKTDGYRQNSLFERFDAGARAESDLNSSLSVRIAGNYHRDRAGLPGPLTAVEVAIDRKQSNNPEDFAQTTDSFVDAGISWLNNGLELDLSGGLRDRKTHAEYVSFGGASDNITRTQSLRPKIIYTVQGSMPVRLLAGADLDESHGNFEYGGAFPLPATSIKRERSGIYGQFEIGSETGRWNGKAGLRSEYVKDAFSQATTSEVSSRKTAWDLGGTLLLTNALRLRLSSSQSFRFPLLDERYSFFSGTVDTVLKPQTGRHYSTALRYDFKHAWLEASFLRADLRDEIFYNPIGGFGFGANENYSDKTRHDLLMLAGHWTGGSILQFGGNVTHSSATFRGGIYDGNTIPAVAATRAAADWTADWNSLLQSVLKLTYVGSSYLISDQVNARSKLPAYLLVDVIMSYHLADMDLFARIDNLTNRKYSSYGVWSSFSGDNFYPAAGTSLRAGVSYQF